jgi:hypothetical protein
VKFFFGISGTCASFSIFSFQNVKDYHGVKRGARNGVDSSDWI